MQYFSKACLLHCEIGPLFLCFSNKKSMIVDGLQ